MRETDSLIDYRKERQHSSVRHHHATDENHLENNSNCERHNNSNDDVDDDNEEEEEEDGDDDDGNSQNSDNVLQDHVHNIKKLPWYSRPSVFSIILVVGSLTMSIAMADPTRQIVLNKLASNTVAKEEMDVANTYSAIAISASPPQEKVQNLVASFNQFLLVGLTLISLPMTAKYGELSNVHGRKPFFTALVLTSLISRAWQYYLYRYSTLQFKSLLIANYIQSLTGGTNIISALANSYVSDITLPSRRTFAFGLASSATFVGQSFGPALGSIISDAASTNRFKKNVAMFSGMVQITHSERVVLVSELLIQLVLLLYVIFLFPESRGAKARGLAEDRVLHESPLIEESLPIEVDLDSKLDKKLSKKESVVIKEILLFMNIFKPLRLLAYSKKVARPRSKLRYSQFRNAVIGLISTSVMYQGLIFAMNELVIQYGIFTFDWNADDISYLLSIISVLRSLVLIAILPVIEKLLKKTFCLQSLNFQFDMVEYLLLMISFIVGFILFILFYFANSTKMFYIAVAVFSLNAIIGPTMDSTILKFYPTSKSAMLFSANILMLNIVCIFTSPSILGIYKVSLQWGNAAFPFLVYAMAMLVFIGIVYRCKRSIHLDTKSRDDSK